jgi:FdhE protein
MSRLFPSPKENIRSRLAAFAQQHPERRVWLRLLEETLHALDEPLWAEAKPWPRREQPAATPLLDGITLAIDGRHAQGWTQRLVRIAVQSEGVGATSLAMTNFSREQTLRLLEAVACYDHGRVQTLAEVLGIDAQALAAVAQLLILPLLQACGRHLASQVSTAWPHGYCPVCGAWPTLAELRGLERTRQLRCGRCGSDWAAAWLRCLYCGEANHQRLGSLCPEGTAETRRVETCITCRGYMKTVTTLQGTPPYGVILEDFATVDLDLVALDRGYTRPERPGYALHLQLRERPGRLQAFFGRNP